MPRLRVYAVDSMPPGIRLKHPVMAAASSIGEAAKILRVTRYHLSVHRLPVLDRADEERALAQPGQRLTVGGLRPW